MAKKSRSSDFKNKVCIISGGRSGIGRAIVDELLKQGNVVVVLGRNEEQLKKSFNMIQKRLVLIEADIRDYFQLKRAVKNIIDRFERIDVLINNASVNYMIHAEKMLPNMIDLSIDTNIRGHMYLTTLVGKQMILQSGFKHVINISAYSGGKAFPGFAHFHACKAGLDAFTRTLAIEWSKYRILVNGICPGPILTENFIHAYTRLERLAGGDAKAKILNMKNIMPLGDFISLDDVVNGALFLISNKANNITGQILTIDGGVGIVNEYFLKKLNLKR